MNKLFITIIAFLSATNLFAQIDFQHNGSYEQATTLAREKGKKIFIDFYTTWCGPCKTMDQEVFNRSDVGSYMNNEFINLKIDAEKGEGISLAKQFNIKAFPTFVVLDPQKKELFRLQGAQPAKQFLENIQKNLDPERQSDRLALRYKNGDRSPQLINDYTLEIMKSGDEKKGFEIVNNYFQELSATDKTDPANLFLYQRYALDIKDIKVQYLLANRQQYIDRLGQEQVNTILYRFVRLGLLTYANGHRIKQEGFNQTDYTTLKKDISRATLPDSLGIPALIKIADAQVTKDLPTILNSYESEFSNITKNDRFILMLTMSAFKDDRLLANRAKTLMKTYISETNAPSQEILKRILFELEEKGPSINFQQLSFQDALTKAKAENKLIFMDCFTDWCGPCKWLDDNTFRDPSIVQYFDTNFINLKVDMEKGEGVELFKKFKIKSFPTMLFISGDGTIKQTLVGALDASKLLQEAKTVK